VKRVGHDDDVVEPDIPLITLDAAYAVAVRAGRLRQGLPRVALLGPSQQLIEAFVAASRSADLAHRVLVRRGFSGAPTVDARVAEDRAREVRTDRYCGGVRDPRDWLWGVGSGSVYPVAAIFASSSREVGRGYLTD
jgi:hypothetical protein